MPGASGSAGMGAWIQACGEHTAAVTREAKAAHLPSSANQHGVKDAPTHPTLPMAESKDSQESSRAGRIAALGTVTSRLLRGALCTQKMHSALSHPSLCPQMGARSCSSSFQPLSSSYTASRRCPFRAHCFSQHPTTSTTSLPPLPTMVLPFLLTLHYK